jgi:hypothetical protein
MTDNHDRSRADILREQWTLAEGRQIQELFRLLAIPTMPGYAPLAITAVGVMTSPAGDVAHYPVYAQLIDSNLSEPSEVRAAIAVLQRWLRVQRRSEPGDSLPWPRHSAGTDNSRQPAQESARAREDRACAKSCPPG